MKDHRDAWGLLAFRRWNVTTDIFGGGDTIHREGAFIFFSALTGVNQTELEIRFSYIKATLRHPINKGLWRRHPDVLFWYGDWNRMSRDQAIALVLSMAALGLEEELEEFYWHLFKRGSFMTNTRHNGVYPPKHPKHNPKSEEKWIDKKIPDLCGPQFWAIFWRFKIKRRGWKYWWAYPLVWCGDIANLVNSWIKVNSYGIDPKNSDDNNHIMMMSYAQRTCESPIARLSRRFYFNDRPFAGDPFVKEYEVTNGPMSAMRHYYDAAAWKGVGASPPIDRLAEPIVNSLGD